MNPAHLVQRQLDAYNARNLQAFVACYSPDVQVYRPPAAVAAMTGSAALADFYARHRFNLPDLHAELLNRMVLGNKVVDHERVSGVREQPFEAAVVYELDGAHIRRVWFFNAD